MICPQCQRENSLDAVFCDACGWRLEAACPSCGEPNRGGAKFCKKCGQRLDRVGAVALKTEQKLAASDVRIPEHLAEKILASRDFMEGERKRATVRFADIKGSTSLVEKPGASTVMAESIRASIRQVRGGVSRRLENRERRSWPRTTGATATVSRLTKQLETSLAKARRPESLPERPRRIIDLD